MTRRFGMQWTAFAVCFLGTSLSLACTQRSAESNEPQPGEEGVAQPPSQPTPAPNANQPNFPPANNGAGESRDTDRASRVSVTAPGDVPVVFSKAALAAAQVYADQLTAKLKYAGEERSEEISFNGDRGEVTFAKLPVGRSSNLTLDLFDGSQHVMTGTAPGVTLKAGSNRIDLQLERVGEQDTSLVLDITLGDRRDDNGNDNNNNDNDQNDRNQPDPDPDPDDQPLDVDLENVYFADVKKYIIDPYCITCHQVDTDMINMAVYPFRSNYFRTQKKIVERMIESTGPLDVRPMPPEPKPRLPAKRRAILERWYAQGIPE